MATVEISANIDETLKSNVDLCLQRAGVSTDEVLRIVWENIAKTHVIPQPVVEEDTNATLEKLRKLREEMPPCPELATMTDAQMRDMLADRYL